LLGSTVLLCKTPFQYLNLTLKIMDGQLSLGSAVFQSGQIIAQSAEMVSDGRSAGKSC
jgi:hypothetical protein